MPVLKFFSMLLNFTQNTNLTDMIQESKPAYLNYYNYHDDQSACSIYKWNDQCVFDQCRMAQTILKHDQIELVQEKNDPKQSKIGFKNAAFLGFKALEHANKNKNLPYCLGRVFQDPSEFVRYSFFVKSQNS